MRVGEDKVGSLEKMDFIIPYELELDDVAVSTVHLTTFALAAFALSSLEGLSKNQAFLRRENGFLIAATRLSPIYWSVRL